MIYSAEKLGHNMILVATHTHNIYVYILSTVYNIYYIHTHMNDVLHQKWQFECIAKFGIERYWKHICYVLWLDCLGQRARTEVWEKHSVTVLYAREEKQLGQHRLGHTPGLWTAMAENSRSMYHVRRQNSWEIYVYMIIYIHIIYILCISCPKTFIPEIGWICSQAFRWDLQD
jgi:hypothetical protein